MKNDIPFIHLIKTPYSYYIFDVNTNSILRTTEGVYNFLLKKQHGLEKVDEIIDDETIQLIEVLKKQGFLSANRPEGGIHHKSEYLEYMLNNKLLKITLQVTQQCNLRCSYCSFSVADDFSQRKHNSKRMNFEMAKKAIDFYIRHSRDSKNTNVSFYGGEPLLEFDLIKKCIEYAEKATEGKELSINITTNGTLLNEEIVEFFYRHNVSLTISIDGPREIQNKQRRFASNGLGTFEKIEENLYKIKEKYPDYFRKISFNAVMDPQNDFSCVNKFFTSCALVKDLFLSASIINDIYSNEKVIYTEKYLIDRKYELFKAFLNRFGIVQSNNLSKIGLLDYTQIQTFSMGLSQATEIPQKSSHAGPCMPGVLRLFVNTEGFLYPCERVSEVSEVMKIGNLNDGFYMEKAKDLLNIGTLTKNECKNCWAYNHCFLCAAFADNMKNLSADAIKIHCKSVREIVSNMLFGSILS